MKIQLNHIALNYEVCGAGEPLVLIGGLTANSREWQRLVPHLEKAFTVYMPENRGVGATTGWTPDFTIEDMADDIAQFIKVLGLNAVYLIGHSMGGAILQRLCIMHPGVVKAAVIASSFAQFPKAAQLYIENTSHLLAAGVNIDLVLKTIYTRIYSSSCLSNDIFVAAELERMLTDPLPQTPEGYEAQVKAIARFNATNLDEIQCPVLIVNGMEDLLTPIYLSEELNHKIRGSSLAFIPDCGHMIPQEKPEAFGRLAVDFFNSSYAADC